MGEIRGKIPEKSGENEVSEKKRNSEWGRGGIASGRAVSNCRVARQRPLNSKEGNRARGRRRVVPFGNNHAERDEPVGVGGGPGLSFTVFTFNFTVSLM